MLLDQNYLGYVKRVNYDGRRVSLGGLGWRGEGVGRVGVGRGMVGSLGFGGSRVGYKADCRVDYKLGCKADCRVDCRVDYMLGCKVEHCYL